MVVKLHHHVPADGELHDCHCVDGAEGDIHWVVMSVVAYQLEVSLLFRAVHIFHCQILIPFDRKRNQVHFTVNEIAETVDLFKPYNVSRFQYRIHTVAADINGSVA